MCAVVMDVLASVGMYVLLFFLVEYVRVFFPHLLRLFYFCMLI